MGLLFPVINICPFPPGWPHHAPYTTLFLLLPTTASHFTLLHYASLSLSLCSDETPQKKDLRRARKIFKNKPKDVCLYTMLHTVATLMFVVGPEWLCVQTHGFGGCSVVLSQSGMLVGVCSTTTHYSFDTGGLFVRGLCLVPAVLLASAGRTCSTFLSKPCSRTSNLWVYTETVCVMWLMWLKEKCHEREIA